MDKEIAELLERLDSKDAVVYDKAAAAIRSLFERCARVEADTVERCAKSLAERAAKIRATAVDPLQRARVIPIAEELEFEVQAIRAIAEQNAVATQESGDIMNAESSPKVGASASATAPDEALRLEGMEQAAKVCDEATYQEAWWLIEGKEYQRAKQVWYAICDRPNGYWRWTLDPHKAARFPTKDAAQQVIYKLPLCLINGSERIDGSMEECYPAEHVFIIEQQGNEIRAEIVRRKGPDAPG